MSTLWTPKLSTLPSVNLRIVDDSDTFDMKALQEALLSSPRVLSVSDTRCLTPSRLHPGCICFSHMNVPSSFV